ncbi:MAG TPA: cytochrome c peroxidase [Telluria sp.]|nr:cytochrome c peroxidase [Telluria sp.]
MIRIVALTFCLVAGLAHAASPVPSPRAEDKAWKFGAPLAEPADNIANPARVELGKTLFFDPRLSGNGTVSCASCHNPGLGWSDGQKKSVGINGQRLGRASPTIVNVAFNTQFMWDGRARSIEDQALGPMLSREEMSTDMEHMKFMLGSLKGYRALFEKAYPGEPVSEQTVAKAIAAFERSVVSRDSRFDKWVGGDRRAISQQEWRGFQLFKGKANCAACHSGPNFTDNGFHNIGLAQDGDVGRYKLRALPSMKGAFKTPTLRDIALTGPYFRDGSATTLRAVVEHYNSGGLQPAPANLSPEVRPLKLTESEIGDLVAFMKTLNGRHVPTTVPVLPH